VEADPGIGAAGTGPGDIEMTTLGLTGRLARGAARRPWTTIGLWLVLLVAAVLATGALLGDALTQDGELTAEIEAETADRLIADARAEAAGDVPDGHTEFVVVEADAGVDDPPTADALGTLVGDVRATEHVTGAVSTLDGAPGLVTEDGHYALVQVTLEGDGDASDLVVPLLGTLEAVDVDGLRVAAVGDGSVNHEFAELAEETLQTGEMFGLSIALVVLVVVFGALVAAFVPIVLAIAAIVLALGLTTLVGQVTDLNLFVVNMITMIGLAVGIDYSLFIVQRVREERRAGRTTHDAIAVAGATATRAVLFSGVTVVIALLGMLLMPDTVFRSLGLGAILVVVAAVLGALTLLPAVLGLLGDRVDALRLPWRRRARAAGTDTLWHRVARRVMARPALSASVAAALLLAMALPYLSIQLGSSGIASLPDDSDARYAYETLNDEFRGGVTTTSIALSADDVTAEGVTSATEALVATLEQEPTYGEVTATPYPEQDLVVVDAVTRVDPSTTEGRDAIHALRSEIIPAALGDAEVEAQVTGQAARDIDYAGLVSRMTPWIFVFVLGLSFLLLLLAFRSVVVPLKAIVMNLLSVGATYGLLVLVFQHGVGADLLGFQTADVIESWVPLFLFTVLFGLSMDYHVFLLSRIKERYDRTGDNAGSVAFGLAATGAIITGAALIMVAVFGGFAAGDLVMFQQMGFGLAVAVILDATVVRSILVPATMALLGDRNWYFPSWLEWLPEIHVEGHVDEPGALEPALVPAAVTTSGRAGPAA
jgi:RND superfamily putative drug exporter